LHKITAISFRQLVIGLKKHGFDGPFSGGKHLYIIKGSARLTIPNPHKEIIGVDLLKRILRQAGISHKEWLS